MQMNNKFDWQHFLKSVLPKSNTGKSTIILRPFRKIIFIVLGVSALLSPIANALSITAEMSPEITAEYKKLFAQQPWPETHTKLASMGNPYKKSYRALKKALKKEAPEGKRRRLMTQEESTFAAKKMRFDYCQASVNFFVDFAKRAYDLSTTELNPLTEDQLMAGNGVKYPFTKEETNNPRTRPAQIALSMGWKYQGKGAQYAEGFLAACLAEPVSLFFKEDKY